MTPPAVAAGKLVTSASSPPATSPQPALRRHHRQIRPSQLHAVTAAKSCCAPPANPAAPVTPPPPASSPHCVAPSSSRTFGTGPSRGPTLLPLCVGFPRLAVVAPVDTAVDTTLAEVARRMLAGLSCCCGGGGDNEATASTQAINNVGVRDGALGAALDAAFARRALQVEALLGYLSALATSPCAEGDRVDLAVAATQLRALGRWKGLARGLPECTVVHGIDGVVVAAPGRAKPSGGGRRRPELTVLLLPNGGWAGTLTSLRQKGMQPVTPATTKRWSWRISRCAHWPSRCPRPRGSRSSCVAPRRNMSLSPVVLRATTANGAGTVLLLPSSDCTVSATHGEVRGSGSTRATSSFLRHARTTVVTTKSRPDHGRAFRASPDHGLQPVRASQGGPGRQLYNAEQLKEKRILRKLPEVKLYQL